MLGTDRQTLQPIESIGQESGRVKMFTWHEIGVPQDLLVYMKLNFELGQPQYICEPLK